MAWSLVNTRQEFEDFVELLKNANPAYDNTTLEGLQNIRSKEGRLAVFDAGSYKVCFGISLDQRYGVRIHIAIPVGDYTNDDLPDIAKILIRGARTYTDNKNARRFYAKTLDDYGDTRLNDLYKKVIPDLMHEVEESESKSGSFHIKFDRDPSRKKDDEKFEGRKKRNPKRRVR